MRFSQSLATIIVSLAVFSTAIPRPVVKSNGTAIKLTEHTRYPASTADIDILNAHVASLSAKVLRGFDNYEKNTGTTHPYAVSGSGMRERGAGTPLMGDQYKVWYTELTIGTPPETFSVQIDTGCSDMFVPWTLCDDSCDGHSLWDPEESSTAESVLRGFSITYTDGAKASGMLYEDNVTISGFTADKQTIGAAMSYSTLFQKEKWEPDGMLGMAFESLSLYPAKPLFTTLVDESKVSEPVFSIKLASNEGELYVGGANPDLYNGEFTYTPVTVQASWQVEIKSIQDEKGNEVLTNVPAVIDTGANCIVGDPTRVSDMYNALGGTHVTDGWYSFPCNSFPTISFSFNGKGFEIPPESLKFKQVSPGSDKCFSILVGKNTGSLFWIIGSPFLRNYYTTFDSGENGENPRVGFAELR